MAEPHSDHDEHDSAESEESSGWDPSMRELIEAVKDEDHPHHAEAVKRNQELAERMKPLMDSIKLPSFSLPESASRLFMDSAATSALKNIAEISRHISVSEQVKNAIAPPQLLAPQPVLHNPIPKMDDFSTGLDEAMEEKKQAEEERIEREVRSIELLQAMTAQIAESNRKIGQLSTGLERINSSLRESDETAASAHKSEMRVGWLTFTVSALALIASIVFFLLGA